jgi:ATP/maltotriose-dependent transcriptional regulator MalT
MLITTVKNRPACPAKVSRPRRPKVYRRQRLFDWLDRAKEYPCIWVYGPPGSGKTTLIADYLNEDLEAVSLWYRVDEADRDRASCFHYLGVAADAVVPGIVMTLPTFSSAFVEALLPRTFRGIARSVFGGL